MVGLSPRPTRPSYQATRYLIENGFEVVGVRPGIVQILGCPCYDSLSEIPGPLEIVDVFRAPQHVPDIVDEVIPLRPKILWLQEGVKHPQAEKRAIKAGIVVVSDRCLAKFHRFYVKDREEAA